MTSRIKIRAVWSEAEALSLAGRHGGSIQGYLKGASMSARITSNTPTAIATDG